MVSNIVGGLIYDDEEENIKGARIKNLKEFAEISE